MIQDILELELTLEGPDNTPLSGICLNSVIGIANLKTLKLREWLNNTEVVVMIDPGVTHNFLSLTLIKKLKIPVATTPGFGVILGTGE